MLALAILLQAQAPSPLNLTCFGGGTADKSVTSMVYGSHQSNGVMGSAPYSANGNGWATVTSSRQQAFQDQVDIRLFSGDDRIRMPPTIVPPIHGGADGWFRLKGVQADARHIRAKVVINFINSPKVFIDRQTGTISISGKEGDFSGQCQAMDVNAPAKF